MENHKNFTLFERDLKYLDTLGGFIPEKVFDMHAHLFDRSFLPQTAAPGSIFTECAPVAGRASYEQFQCPLYPGIKRLRLNVISTPDGAMADRSNGLRAHCNEFLTRHLERNPDDVGEAFVLPDDSDAEIHGLLVHPNIRGFKCYHLTAVKKPTMQAEIAEYLPESAWRAADERGLCITLHLVKNAALADPGNLWYIREKARAYPSARLVLAHAARGFAAWTALEGAKKVAEFPNIYFDVSAVCEPTAIFAVLKAAGPKRVLWGSDFPVSMMRGKCVSLAETFLWLDSPLIEEPAILVGIENLGALKQACDMLNISRGSVEDIFTTTQWACSGLPTCRKGGAVPWTAKRKPCTKRRRNGRYNERYLKGRRFHR